MDEYPINEAIEFNSFIDEQFIVVKINYAERQELGYEEKEELVYLFLEDLIDKQFIRITYSDDAKIKIYLELKTPFKPKFDDYDKVPNKLLPEEDPGMIAIGKTTNEFIEAITPIRRFKTDLNYIYFNKHP